MVKLQQVVEDLDELFRIYEFGPDSGFSRHLPTVYDNIEYDWKNTFEPNYTKLFNGLMIKGDDHVSNIFLAVFPTDFVLEAFIQEGEPGDLLFMHHPLVMECGDPRGEWGRGFVPIKHDYIKRMKEKGLSVYTCHVPLDFHEEVGTSVAIAEAIGASVEDRFIESEHGPLGLIGEIQPTSTKKLIAELESLFHIPYVDFDGITKGEVSKVAIVAGCGDKVDWMQEAEAKGVEAYITGEIHCHIDNDYGKKKFEKMMDYAQTTTMSLIGVSHSASEYLVKDTLIKSWFREQYDINTVMVPQEKWWL